MKDLEAEKNISVCAISGERTFANIDPYARLCCKS